MDYKSTIKSRPYFYKETKKVATLIHQGLDIDKIKQVAIDENIFQVDTETRRREIASIISYRLNGISPEVIEAIAQGSIETSKVLVVYAIMRTDRLFYEFMNEVFKEKLLLRELYLEDKDIDNFFEIKRQQSEKVASWSEYTFKKLKQVYIRILFESGLIKTQKGKRPIEVPVLERNIRKQLLSSSEAIYIKALEGES